MKHFFLRGEEKTQKVWLDEEELLPIQSQEIVNHSPDGFAWGYGGSGPSQLSLAVMLEVLKNKRNALENYIDFKWQCISHLTVNKDFLIDVKGEEIGGKWIWKYKFLS